MSALRNVILCVAALVFAGCARGPSGPIAPIEDRREPARPPAVAPAAPTQAPRSMAAARPAPPSAVPSASNAAADLPRSMPPLAPPAAETLPARTLGSGAQSLVFAATQAARAGQWEQAQAALERAIKLEPGSAQLWRKLAMAHLRAGDVERAREFALRARVLAGSDRAETAAVWQVIADIETARGDAAAAAAARAAASAP